jgi:hypothetical protein
MRIVGVVPQNNIWVPRAAFTTAGIGAAIKASVGRPRGHESRAPAQLISFYLRSSSFPGTLCSPRRVVFPTMVCSTASAIAKLRLQLGHSVSACLCRVVGQLSKVFSPQSGQLTSM